MEKRIDVSCEALNIYNKLQNKNVSDMLKTKEEIIDEFKNSKKLKQYTTKKAISITDDFIFYHSNYSKRQTIHYMFRNNKPIRREKIVLNAGHGIDNPLALNILFGFIATNNETIIKQWGSKMLIVLDRLLIVLRKEAIRYTLVYKVLEVVEVTSSENNLEKLENIRDKYTLKNIEYDSILNYFGIYKQTHQVSKEILLPEEEIYEQVLKGELKRFPNRFWADDVLGSHYEAAVICTKYMFEKVLKWDFFDVCNKLTKNTFMKYKLGGMMEVVFSGNLFYTLDNAYPNKFKPFYLKKYRSDWYWSKEHDGLQHARDAKDYLMQQLSLDGIKINENNLLSYDWTVLLNKYNMLGVLSATYEGDLQWFFKDYFNKEINSGLIESYKYKYRLTSGNFKMHR